MKLLLQCIESCSTGAKNCCLGIGKGLKWFFCCGWSPRQAARVVPVNAAITVQDVNTLHTNNSGDNRDNNSGNSRDNNRGEAGIDLSSSGLQVNFSEAPENGLNEISIDAIAAAASDAQNKGVMTFRNGGPGTTNGSSSNNAPRNASGNRISYAPGFLDTTRLDAETRIDAMLSKTAFGPADDTRGLSAADLAKWKAIKAFIT